MQPRDLTVPIGGSTTARDVLSRALRRLLDDLRALPEAHDPTPAGRATYRAFRKALAHLLRTDPGAVASLLRHPTVAVYVRTLRAREPGPGTDSLLAALVATATLELAWTKALTESLRVTRLPSRIVCLPGRFALRVGGDVHAITFGPGQLTLHGAQGDREVLLDDRDDPAIERPFHAIADEAVLALADDNPLAMEEAHPDKHGNAVDLGGRTPGEWVTALRDALLPIEAHLPELRREIGLYLQQVVPVGYHAEAHLSASYRESVGTIYLSLHPQPLTMTEALIHEHSHNKLNALLELDPLLHDALEPLHRSPVRPDARPLQGVLLAVHAFVPVAVLYERMAAAGHPWAARPDFQRRFREILRRNGEGTETLLAHARPTPTGRALLDELAGWHTHFTKAVGL